MFNHLKTLATPNQLINGFVALSFHELMSLGELPVSRTVHDKMTKLSKKHCVNNTQHDKQLYVFSAAFDLGIRCEMNPELAIKINDAIAECVLEYIYQCIARKTPAHTINGVIHRYIQTDGSYHPSATGEATLDVAFDTMAHTVCVTFSQVRYRDVHVFKTTMKHLSITQVRKTSKFMVMSAQCAPGWTQHLGHIHNDQLKTKLTQLVNQHTYRKTAVSMITNHLGMSTEPAFFDRVFLEGSLAEERDKEVYVTLSTYPYHLQSNVALCGETIDTCRSEELLSVIYQPYKIDYTKIRYTLISKSSTD